jgi:hypothetical protein
MPLLTQDSISDPYAPGQQPYTPNAPAAPLNPDAPQGPQVDAQGNPTEFHTSALSLINTFDDFVKGGGDINKLSKENLDAVKYAVENMPSADNKADSPSVMYSLFTRGQEHNLAIQAGQQGALPTLEGALGTTVGAAPDIIKNLGGAAGTFLLHNIWTIPLAEDVWKGLTTGNFDWSNVQNNQARQQSALVQAVQTNWDNYTSDIPAGIKDVASLYSLAKQRAATKDPDAASRLDLQQSEILRSQVVRDQQHAKNATDALEATARVLKSVGLGAQADALLKAKPDEADKFGWGQITDPLNWATFGAEAGVKAVAEQFIKAGVRTSRLAEATTALSSVENKLAGLASARTSYTSALVGDITGKAPTLTESARAGLQSNIARIDVVNSNMQKDLAAARAEHAAAVADVNKQLDAAAIANPFRGVIGGMAASAGATGQLASKIPGYVASLPGQIVDRFAWGLDEATKAAAVQAVNQASQGALSAVAKLSESAIGGAIGFHGVGALAGGILGTAAGPMGAAIGTAVGPMIAKALPNLKDLGEFAKIVKIIGEQYSLGQQTLPYWRNVASKLDGVPAWIASKLDNQLVYSIPSAVTGGVMGAGMGGVSGLSAGGGRPEQFQSSLVGGGVIGAAGGGLGQLRRFNSTGALRQAAIGDRSRFISSLTTPSKNMFLKLDPEYQLGIANYAVAHPDAEFRFVADPSGPNGKWTANNPNSVIEINVASKNPLQAVAAHEVGHHIAEHGLQQQVYNNILGDPATGQRGIMTQLDDKGNPLMEFDPASGRRNFVQNAEFEKYKADYNARLLRDNPGGTPATDKDIALEMFADLHAQYMHNPADLQRTIRGVLPSDLVSENATANWLTKMGMGADAQTGHPIATATLERARALQNIMDTYYRQTLAKRGDVSAPRGDQKTVKMTANDYVKGTPEFDRMQINLDSSGDVQRNPDGSIATDMSGRPIFKTSAQSDADAVKMGKAIHDIYHAQPNLEGTPNDNYIRVVTDRDGTQTRRGQRMPEAVIQELERTNQFNASQLLNMRKINGVMPRNDGSMMEAVYNTATKGKGRYATLPVRERAFVPVNWEVSLKNNQVNVTGYDPEQLTANITKGLKSQLGRQLYPEGKVGPAFADAQTYLQNIANDRPGETSIGMQKKIFHNRMMGLASDANPGAADLLKKAPSVIKSFRVDRLNRIREVAGSDIAPFHEKTYEQIRSFLQPRETPPPAGFDVHESLSSVFGHGDAQAMARALANADSSKGVAQHWKNALLAFHQRKESK